MCRRRNHAVQPVAIQSCAERSAESVFGGLDEPLPDSRAATITASGSVLKANLGEHWSIALNPFSRHLRIAWIEFDGDRVPAERSVLNAS